MEDLREISVQIVGAPIANLVVGEPPGLIDMAKVPQGGGI